MSLDMLFAYSHWGVAQMFTICTNDNRQACNSLFFLGNTVWTLAPTFLHSAYDTQARAQGQIFRRALCVNTCSDSEVVQWKDCLWQLCKRADARRLFAETSSRINRVLMTQAFLCHRKALAEFLLSAYLFFSALPYPFFANKGNIPKPLKKK